MIEKLAEDEHIQDYYHGTSADALWAGERPILRYGIAPSGSGTGQDKLARFHGFAVPGVYLSRNPSTAAGYPAGVSAPKHDFTKNERKANPAALNHVPTGAQVICKDGTIPLKFMVRCIGFPTSRLWHKIDKSNDQHLFPANETHISHLIITGHPTRCQVAEQLLVRTIQIPLTIPFEVADSVERCVYGTNAYRDKELHNNALKANSSLPCGEIFKKWADVKISNKRKRDEVVAEHNSIALAEADAGYVPSREVLENRSAELAPQDSDTHYTGMVATVQIRSKKVK
jgi:hypothetical protein